MTAADWSGWVSFHAATFDLQSEHDLAMFAAWREVFGVAGYGADELREATIWIATHNQPRFRADHLAALTARILDRRRAMLLANQAAVANDGREAHGLCQGTGWVNVPHPRSLLDGEWVAPWYTVAVVCVCPRGSGLRGIYEEATKPNGDRRPMPMSFEFYEQRNPDWKRQLDQRKAIAAASARAQSASEYADRHAARLPISKVLNDLKKERK